MPSQWIDLLKYEFIGDKIYENLQNAYCTPLECFVEENFDIWHSKIHGPFHYLQSFYLAALIQKCRETHYPYAQFRNGISRKRTISSYNESMNNGNSSSSFDNETTPKVRKGSGINFNAKFDKWMKTICELIIEADNELFQNRTKKPTFVLCSFQPFLSSKLDRLSLQQLECEMDSADYHDKYKIFNIRILWSPSVPLLKYFSLPSK